MIFVALKFWIIYSLTKIKTRVNARDHLVIRIRKMGIMIEVRGKVGGDDRCCFKKFWIIKNCTCSSLSKINTRGNAPVGSRLLALLSLA